MVKPFHILLLYSAVSFFSFPSHADEMKLPSRPEPSIAKDCAPGLALLSTLLGSDGGSQSHSSSSAQNFVETLVDQVLIPAFQKFNIRRDQTLDLLKDPLRGSLKSLHGTEVGAIGPLLSSIQKAVIDRGAEAQALFGLYFQKQLGLYLSNLEVSTSRTQPTIQAYTEIQQAWSQQTKTIYGWIERDRQRNLFILGSLPGGVDILDPLTRRIKPWLNPRQNPSSKMLFQWDKPLSRVFTSAEGDSEVKCFEFGENKPCSKFQWKSRPFRDIFLSPDGRYLFGVHKSDKRFTQLVSVWDTRIGSRHIRRAPLKVFEFLSTKRIDALALSPNLKFLIANTLHELDFVQTVFIDFENAEFLFGRSDSSIRFPRNGLAIGNDSSFVAFSSNGGIAALRLNSSNPSDTFPLNSLWLGQDIVPAQITLGERRDSLLVANGDLLGVWSWDTRQQSFSLRSERTRPIWSAAFEAEDRAVLYSVGKGELIYRPLAWKTPIEDQEPWASSPPIEAKWAQSWWKNFRYRLRGGKFNE